MNIGIIREIEKGEKRVPLTPATAQYLIKAGHTVYFQAGAGKGASFSDEDYLKVGAEKVYNDTEVFGRADIVLKIVPVKEDEVEKMREEQCVFSFHHLAVQKKSVVEKLVSKRITLIGYEVIEKEDGSLPCLDLMSEIAGLLSPVIAGHYLKSDVGGKGLLLSGVTSVPPATVVIIGCGNVGKNAAKAFLGAGAHVIVLDINISKLKELEEQTGRRVITALANPYNISKYVEYADVLIGAVLIPGERAPVVITKELLSKLRPGSVVMDISIDQGGCIEGTRPTTLESPVYIEDEKIFYCVPNIPSTVSRTASIGLSNVFVPYLLNIARNGLEEALQKDKSLATGVYMYKGNCTRQGICDIFGMEFRELKNLLKR
ncbi:MAG: alanine dehydrogenase [Candidatus Aminicenantia bacterium]